MVTATVCLWVMLVKMLKVGTGGRIHNGREARVKSDDSHQEEVVEEEEDESRWLHSGQILYSQTPLKSPTRCRCRVSCRRAPNF
mmetsp:Transcript_17692/g.36221  ORF Transcript_17692/g.36221 Transcript_17692/m.36221 type:complete len:84 (-) Transcript_17692:1711-1962(-)